MRTISTDIGEVLLNIVSYPNGSHFVWISRLDAPEFDDFHIASITEFSDIPSVSTRLGETDSLGRALSIKLARRFHVPSVVSWSLGVEFESVSQVVEKEVFRAILEKQSSHIGVGV